MPKGLLVVLSGPSGVGKGTLCRALLRACPELKYSVSATTRKPRPGEKEGEDYYFLSGEEFRRLLAQGAFLEWASVYGNLYGTPREKVEAEIAAGHNVLLEIDPQGARQVRALFPEGVFIFIIPPSEEVLRDRMQKRGSEKGEELEARFQAAKEELKLASNYDYVVVNDDFNLALEKLKAILATERSRRKRLCLKGKEG